MAGSKGKGPAGSLIELVSIVAVALGLALGIQAFLVKPFRIPSESMVPTLEVGQRVLVDRFSGHFSQPGVGSVVVFKPPRGADNDTCGVQHPEDAACSRPTPGESETNFIKRVVAVGGDTVAIRRGRVYRNGKLAKEPFIQPDATCEICDLPRPIKVPADHYFMMGDNRGQSDDSRKWGPVPEESLIGKAFMTYWPPNRIGGL